jgi:hypothetical protein
MCCLALAGCGGGDERGERERNLDERNQVEVPTPEPSDQVDGAIPESSEICEMIAAQKKVNGDLAADGYADDYSDTYDAMADAEDCPAG